MTIKRQPPRKYRRKSIVVVAHQTPVAVDILNRAGPENPALWL